MGMLDKNNKSQDTALTQADEQCLAADSAVNSALRELGKAYFEAYKDNAEVEYAEKVTDIKNSMEKAKLWRQYRLSLEGKTKCEKCGAIITADSIFCNKCGEKIPVWNFSQLGVGTVNIGAATSLNTCPTCGRQLPSGASFCEMCGCKIR